jgi:two-component system, NarL family, response regulator DevR
MGQAPPFANQPRMKVFIVEDAPETRQELVELFGSVKGLEVVGQAGSVREAIADIEATAPQAVTLDISLPDGSGVEVLKHIHKRGWKLFVVVLTGNLYEALFAKCQQLGAAAVLDKLNGLAQAAEALLAGRPDSQTRSER